MYYVELLNDFQSSRALTAWIGSLNNGVFLLGGKNTLSSSKNARSSMRRYFFDPDQIERSPYFDLIFSLFLRLELTFLLSYLWKIQESSDLI